MPTPEPDPCSAPDDAKAILVAASSANLERLTPRQAEVLYWVTRGLKNREIANRMVVGEEAIKTHVKDILGKLGVQTRAGAAAWASRILTERRGSTPSHDVSEPASMPTRVGALEIPARMLIGTPGYTFGIEQIIVDVVKGRLPSVPPEVDDELRGAWNQLASREHLEYTIGAHLVSYEMRAGKLCLTVTPVPFYIYAVLRRMSPLLPTVQQWSNKNAITASTFWPMGCAMVARCADDAGNHRAKLIFKVRPARNVLADGGLINTAADGYIRYGRDSSIELTRTANSNEQLAEVCPFATAWHETKEEQGFEPEWNWIHFFGVAKDMERDAALLVGMVDTPLSYRQILGLRGRDSAEPAPPEDDCDMDCEKALEVHRAENGRVVRFPVDFTPQAVASAMRHGNWLPGTQLSRCW